MGSTTSSKTHSPTRRFVSMLLFLACAYFGLKVIPVAVATFRFSEAMNREVMYGRIDEPISFIHSRLMAEASRLGVELRPEDVVIERNGAALRIHSSYVMRVDLIAGIGFDWTLHPDHRGTRRPQAFGDG